MTKETLHIYTRVSTQAQQDDGTSLESQKELGIKKAKELGYANKVWNEGGASSHYEDLQNRPILLSLLSEINDGKVGHLWVFNNDRLSRNDVTAQTIRLALQKNGVTLYTQNGKFDLNNPQDKLMKTFFDGIAQFDNALRAERTRLGKINRIKKGFWMGGPPPFGYQITDKKLELHPVESKWVKAIYEWYSSGKSIEWIKSSLDKEGVATRREKVRWSLGSIRKILQNTHPTGHFNYIDSKTNEVLKCTCSPIVSQTLWNKCQEKRKQTLARRGQNNRTKRSYLLRNILYCGHCGSHMSGRIKEDKNEYLYYCPKKERQWVKSAPKDSDKWKRGKGCSMTRSLNIPATDSFVMDNVFKIALKQVFLNKKLKRSAKNANPSSEDQAIQLKKLQNKQKSLSKELDATIQSIADVEAAKMLGKQDARIAKKVLENLNSSLRNTESQIEQCKIQIKSLHSKDEIGDLLKSSRLVKPNLQIVEMPSKHMEKLHPRFKSMIERIDVFYDKDKNEHKLIVRFKLPLVDGQNDLTLDLKKNRKAA